MGNVPAVMHGFRPETRHAFDTVVRALKLAGRSLGLDSIKSKGGRDVVTATDIAVEDAVRELLTSVLSVPVVGEERGGEVPADGSAYWLVDPICGTRNLASGIPLYCVNLALVEGDHVTVAVVGDVSTGEITFAERERGAWVVNHGTRRRLTTSDASRTVVIEHGKSQGARRAHGGRVAAEVIRADLWDVRSLGTTLSASYLAAGRIAAYVEMWVTALHAAAGSLLIAEAGGTLSDIDGHPWTIQSDSLVASATPGLQHELLTLIRATAAQAG